jgi:hypothetical protein
MANVFDQFDVASKPGGNVFDQFDKPASFSDRFDAAPKPPAPSITDAVTDIPHETMQAAHDAWNTIKALSQRGEMGPVEGLMATGKALLAVPALIGSPITGAARSLIGHPMAQAEHVVGTVIAPEIAAKDDPQAMYQAAKGDVDTAMSAMRGKAPAEAAAAVKPPTIAELKASATRNYESPEVTGLTMKSSVLRNFGTAASQAMANDGFDPLTAPKTFGLLKNIEGIPEEATVTGANLNTLRKMFGKAAQSQDPTEKAAASKVIGYIDDVASRIPDSEVLSGDVGAASKKLQDARGDYAAAKQAENIDNKVVSAELRASATHSGQNVANTIRQRMASVVDPTKPKEGVGLRQDELDQAEQIARGTPTQNAIRKVGNFLGGGGGLGALHTSAAGAAGGGMVAGPVGAAIGSTVLPITGAMLKAISNRMTISQANKLSEMIRSRAPLASSAQKFEEAAARAAQKQTTSNMVGFSLAARNLSNNLRTAGFNISTGDLISGLQSPGTSQAQDNQQDVPRPPSQ